MGARWTATPSRPCLCRRRSSSGRRRGSGCPSRGGRRRRGKVEGRAAARERLAHGRVAGSSAELARNVGAGLQAVAAAPPGRCRAAGPGRGCLQPSLPALCCCCSGVAGIPLPGLYTITPVTSGITGLSALNPSLASLVATNPGGWVGVGGVGGQAGRQAAAFHRQGGKGVAAVACTRLHVHAPPSQFRSQATHPSPCSHACPHPHPRRHCRDDDCGHQR